MTMPTILIVDDEEPIRNLLKRILERKSYSLLLAGDAREARSLLRETAVDLILCDVMMPDESGLDLIRFIKEAYPETGIVMVTAMDDEETSASALTIGVYGYIVKPFGEKQVVISVSNALRMRELERNARFHREDLEQTVLKRTAELEEKNRQLTAREAELRERADELMEVNSALRVLLKKWEEDKAVLEENVLSQMKDIALPYLDKLKDSGLNLEQRSLVQILESSLNELTSPMARTLTSKSVGLTPTELQVADLIKHGKRTKEIADMLHLSTNTIVSHRYNIRTKLGLKNRKINLQSYLQAFPS